MRRAIYPLYALADEGKVKPILDALRSKKTPIRDRQAEAARGDALLLFLSKNLSGEGPEADAFFRLNAGRELVIPVNLDGCAVPEELQSALMARHSLDGAKYRTEELAERIAKAAAGEKKSRLPLVLSLLGVAALLAVGGLIAWNQMGRPDLRDLFVQATPTPTPTPTVTPTPTPTPVPTPTPPLPDNADITLEQLESIFELIIVGDSFNAFYGDEEWMVGSGNARVGVEHVAIRGFENDAPRWYSTENGHTFELCDWGGLEFLPYMKNLTLLTLVNVQGTLPDLSGLENLNCLELFDCAIDDISGAKGASHLIAFNYYGPARDLSLLNGCGRLRSMNLQFYGSDRIDLASFCPPNLQELHIWTDGAAASADLGGLTGCHQLNTVHLEHVPVQDLRFLSGSEALQRVELFGLDALTSLEGLAGQGLLRALRLDNCPRLSPAPDALSGCSALTEIFVQDCPLRDLIFLTGATALQRLRLENMGSIRSFQGLEDHMALKAVEATDLNSLTDISALSSCTALMSLQTLRTFALRDISPVTKLPKLRDLQIYGADINDVNFLWDIQNKDYFSFGIAEVDDWSGLAAIQQYSFLNVTDRSGSALPYIDNATVTDFELWNRGGIGNRSEGMDMTRLPHVTNELWLHCVTSLDGLDQPDVRRVTLDDCPYLTSLSGLEGTTKLVHLEIRNCPRLNDWSAINGRKLDEIILEALFSLPDFGNFSAKEVSLTTIYDLEDLNCFQNFRQDGYRIRLFDVDGVTDLSPLYRLHGACLEIPAHLKEAAQALVDSGLLDEYEVTYPEGWWEPIEPHIELMSLEEIDTLPSALLARINSLTLAGDAIVPQEGAWMEEDYSSYPPALYVRYDGEEERFSVEPGTLADLSVLSKLTGLEDLSVYAQPRLASLEGIENMSGLKRLNIYQAAALEDASAAFTVQSLEELSLRFTAINAIQGVQNLYALRRLDVNDSPVADLSPLTACPALEEVNFFLPMMTFEQLKAQPELVRQNIRSLTVAGEYVYDGGPWWFEADWVTDPPTLYLHSNETDERLPLTEGAVTDMAELAALLPNMERLCLYGQPLATLDGMEGFEQLREITIEECRRIADFSALWRSPALEDISLKNEPIESLEGIENLPHLVSLNLSGTNVRDFSPLTRVDYSYCTSEDYFGYGFMLALDVRDAQSLTFEAYAALEAVPVYRHLNLNNVPVTLWYDHLTGKELYEFSCHRCDMSDEQLKVFVESHPMLEKLTLSWNPQLTDLNCLREVPDSHLSELCLSEDMQKAVESLGEGYAFRLEIE